MLRTTTYDALMISHCAFTFLVLSSYPHCLKVSSSSTRAVLRGISCVVVQFFLCGTHAHLRLRRAPRPPARPCLLAARWLLLTWRVLGGCAARALRAARLRCSCQLGATTTVLVHYYCSTGVLLVRIFGGVVCRLVVGSGSERSGCAGRQPPRACGGKTRNKS